jgi:hypothetical protein
MLARRFWAFLDSLGPLDGSDHAVDDALETYVRRLQGLARRADGHTEVSRWHHLN